MVDNKTAEAKYISSFVALIIMVLAVMDILILYALINTTLSDTNALIAGVATVVLSLAAVVDTIINARRKLHQPPSQAAP